MIGSARVNDSQYLANEVRKIFLVVIYHLVTTLIKGRRVAKERSASDYNYYLLTISQRKANHVV